MASQTIVNIGLYTRKTITWANTGVLEICPILEWNIFCPEIHCETLPENGKYENIVISNLVC